MTESTPRTMRDVPPKMTRSEPAEVKAEGNLLIEAVSLLVQRQRETEGWVAEQIWQADERAAAAERRYADLEVRLAGIEEHLSRLVQEVEPAHGDALVDERLSRLREQVEGLKTADVVNRAAVASPEPHAIPEPRLAHDPRPAPEPRRAPEPQYTEPTPAAPVASARPRVATTAGSSNVGLLD